jgi:hypothetical protein
VKDNQPSKLEVLKPKIAEHFEAQFEIFRYRIQLETELHKWKANAQYAELQAKAYRDFEKANFQCRVLIDQLLSRCEPTAPPSLAEFLFALCGPKDRIETMLGDLQEFYEVDCKMKGIRRAKALYWARALRSVLPLLILKLRNWGALAALVEYGRGKIGW